MNIRAVVTAYNQFGYTSKNIQQLIKAGFSNLSIIQNGNTNLAPLKNEGLSFDLITNRDLPKWSQALNKYIPSFEEEWLCIVHNDCIVGSSFLSKIEKHLSSPDPQVRILVPWTNYSRYDNLVHNPIKIKAEQYKPPNKVNLSLEQVNSVLEKAYGSLDDFTATFKVVNFNMFCQDFDSYCFLIRTQDWIPFNEEFITLGWMEKLWYQQQKRLGNEAWLMNDVYVHHHGNLTTDGIPFNYPEMYNQDRQLYDSLTNNQIS